MKDIKLNDLRDSFHPYAIITILCWSLAYVLTRMALPYFSAFSLGFLRYLAASAALVMIVAVMKMRLPRKADLRWFAVSGAAGFFIYMIAFNKGEETILASTSSMIIATVPIITAMLARLIYKERLCALQWAAIAMEFTGVLVLTIMKGGLLVNTGLFWLLLAAFSLSVYNLLQRKLTRTYTALQTSAFSIFLGTAMLAVFLPESIEEASAAPPIQLLYLVILGVFSSAIAYVAWSKAFAKAAKTSQVSNYMFATPFFTTLLGYLMAKEIPDGATLLGGAIILAGILVFNESQHFQDFLKNHRNCTNDSI